MDNHFIGNWRITEMGTWDKDYIDLISPGQIRFDLSGSGSLHFGAIDAQLNWQITSKIGMIEFFFEGFDEGDQVSGRGWATLDQDKLTGHIYFHQGDDSNFNAMKTRKHEDTN